MPPLSESVMEVWREFAGHHGGSFLVDESDVQGPPFMKTVYPSCTVEVDAGGWPVVFKAYTTHSASSEGASRHSAMNEVSVDYSASADRRRAKFHIYRASFFSRIAKRLGMKDFATGDKEFDEKFIVKGDDERTALALATNSTIRSTLKKHKVFYLQSDGKELRLHIAYVFIPDIDRLEAIYNMFSETLSELERLGVVAPADTKSDG